jgi:indolepyruvate ferredoxin oxidoreductase, alpha subunit
VLVIMKNGYTSATGTQEHLSTPPETARRAARGGSATGRKGAIEATLKGLGVGWLRTVHTHRVGRMKNALIESMKSPFAGLKVIVAEGECQLERQRRLRPAARRRPGRGTARGAHPLWRRRRHVHRRSRLHPPLRLPIPDRQGPGRPLKTDPVTHVTNGCLGCGLCGELAHEARLCPSFWRADIVANPRWYEVAMARMRAAVVRAPLS